MEHDPNDPMCKCEKCMTAKAADMCSPDAPCGNCEKCMTTKAACTPDSADCNDPMCKVCAKKFWSGSAFGKK